MVNNKDNRVFMSRNYRSDSCIFALEASLLGQIFVLRTSNFRGATIKIYVSTEEILASLLANFD